MKVALCISGQYRTHQDCIPSWRTHIIDKWNPDIFFHTWDIAGNGSATPFVTDALMKRHYIPKAYSIEQFKTDYHRSISGIALPQSIIELEPSRYAGTLPLLYSMRKCDDLRRQYEHITGTRYDIVIKTRPDIMFFGPSLKLEHVSFNEIRTEICMLNSKYQTSDKFAYSNGDCMAKYCSVIEHVERYWQAIGCPSSWDRVLIGERLMRHHFFQSGLLQKPANSLFYIRRRAAINITECSKEILKSTVRYYINNRHLESKQADWIME